METIERHQVDEIATQVAAEILGAALVSSAVTTMTVDSRGRDALKITINLAPRSAAGITGKAASTTVLALKQKLQEAGEGVNVSPGTAPIEVKRWKTERVRALLARFSR